MTITNSRGRARPFIRCALAGLALGLLAACDGVIDVTRSAPQSIAVTGDEVVIAGPPGFCVDRGASREEGGGAFVLLGSCAAITNNARAPSPDAPKLATVTVSDGMGTALSTALLNDMAAFIRTDEGRAALSRAGDAETVTILGTRVRNGALYIHARDTSSDGMGMAPDYWRALFGVKDRLLTVSVAGFDDTPLSQDAGLSTLDEFAARIRAANRG